MLHRRDGEPVNIHPDYYRNAAIEVTGCIESSPLAMSSDDHSSTSREQLLASLFFLSYSDILSEPQRSAADINLKRAYTIFQQGQKSNFTPVEKQFLQWIRLLDARAVSAGGQGLFLSKDDELLLVEASPASLQSETVDAFMEDPPDEEIEDVLFQVLYHPGVTFFQKVQELHGPNLKD